MLDDKLMMEIGERERNKHTGYIVVWLCTVVSIVQASIHAFFLHQTCRFSNFLIPAWVGNMTKWGIEEGNKVQCSMTAVHKQAFLSNANNWPLDLTCCFPYRHLSFVSSIQEGSSDGQHGVARFWPKCGEDFMNHRVLDTKTDPCMSALMCFVYLCLIFVKYNSYHKREARHLGYLVTAGDLHCVSWWGEVPSDHWVTLDLSPPKQKPTPNNTQTTALYRILLN